MSNQHPIAFCHGLFGWGNKALRIDYWGLASEVDSCGLPVFEASVGPVSSFQQPDAVNGARGNYDIRPKLVVDFRYRDEGRI